MLPSRIALYKGRVAVKGRARSSITELGESLRYIRSFKYEQSEENTLDQVKYESSGREDRSYSTRGEREFVRKSSQESLECMLPTIPNRIHLSRGVIFYLTQNFV